MYCIRKLRNMLHSIEQKNITFLVKLNSQTELRTSLAEPKICRPTDVKKGLRENSERNQPGPSKPNFEPSLNTI